MVSSRGGFLEPDNSASRRHQEEFRAVPKRTQLFRDTLGLRPGEYARTAAFFAYLVAASAIFIAGRTVRDTLFLSRYDISTLPWMYLVYAVVSILLATFYGGLADRWRRDRLIVCTALVSAASYVAVWAAIRAHVPWIDAFFYIWAEVVGTLFVSQFWLFANDLHSSREAKRLFGVIGSGRVLGVVVTGVWIRSLAQRIGSDNLLLAIAGLMLCVVVLVTTIQKRFGALALPDRSPARRLAAQSSAGTRRPLMDSRHARLLAGVSFLTFLVCQLADYQFKAIARATWRGDALAAYFGSLYAAIGSVAFLIQIFLTRRVLASQGLVVALLAMPAALTVSSLGLALLPGIAAASLLKFSDNTFQYSINEAALQMLYFPFPEATRGRLRAMLDGCVIPAAFGVSGVILLAWAPRVSIPGLCAFTLPLLAVWAAAVRLMGREYVSALAATLRDKLLRQGHGELIVRDPLTQQSLLELVRDPSEETALFALDRLRRLSPDALTHHLDDLMASPHDKVRIAALELLENSPDPAKLPLVERALGRGSSRQLRTAAIGAYCAHVGEDALELTIPLLATEDKQLWIAALAGTMKHCGIDGVLSSGPELQRLLLSGAEHDRLLACRVLGKIGGRHFYRPLIPMLSDPSGRVRREAAIASGEVLNPKLLPALVTLLGDEDASEAVKSALIRYGDEAVAVLGGVLAEPSSRSDVARACVSILRRIGTDRALGSLIDGMDHENARVRGKILRAVARLHRELGSPDVLPAEQMERRLAGEIQRGYQTLAEREAVLSTYPGHLLRDTFEHDFARCLERIWNILSVFLPPGVVRRCEQSLRSGTPAQKANALEVLDNTLRRGLKEPLLGLLEDRPLSERLAAGRRSFVLTPVTADGWLEKTFEAGGWHRAVALDAVGYHRIARFVPQCRSALTNPTPLVREVALWALLRLQGAGAAGDVGAMMTHRALWGGRLPSWVESLAAGGIPGALDAASGMLFTTLEEVVYMRHIPIFQGVASKQLAALAEIAEEVFAAPGEAVVREGEPGDSLYLVMKGRVEATHRGARVAELGPEECFGEMTLIQGEPRAATVRALEPTELLTISHVEFLAFLEERPEVARNVLRILSRRIRELDRELAAAKSGAAEKEEPV